VSATVFITDNTTTTFSETVTVSAVAGQATFTPLTSSAPVGLGYQLRYTLQSNGATATSGYFDILHSEAHSFAFAAGGNIATGESGKTLKGLSGGSIVLEIFDRFGNKVLGDTSTVLTATVTSGSADVTSLNGRTARAVNGVVTFNNLVLNAKAQAGYVISFTAANAGTGVNAKVVASAEFNLLAGTAAQLNLVTQSAGIRSGKDFASYPALQILDAEGSLINSGPNATLSATVAISHVAGGTGALPSLSGTVSVEAVAGVVDFTGSSLKLNGPVGFYVLTYTITNSNNFDIVSNDPNHFVYLLQSTRLFFVPRILESRRGENQRYRN
jgi:hypothetical protein